MPSEKHKMLAGELYDSIDPELVAERDRSRRLCHQLNTTAACAPQAERRALLAQLFGAETDAYVTAPFFCDYGYNIRLGRNAYFNFNCVLLDVMPICIGTNFLAGPGVHIYTAAHPLQAVQRRAGLEFAKPVLIGDDVWLGGGVVVCPGVSIGSAAVVAAGSVVTHDIPPGVLAAGNPSRVIRSLA